MWSASLTALLRKSQLCARARRSPGKISESWDKTCHQFAIKNLRAVRSHIKGTTKRSCGREALVAARDFESGTHRLSFIRRYAL